MKSIWMPLAWYGGRSWGELEHRDAGECDTSIAVGLLGLVSIGIIFAGHLLFWSHLPHTSASALAIAGFIATLFALLYRVLLRAMEVMGWLAKGTMLVVLVGVMGVNAALAGHELVLLAFRPQVESQARLSAAQGVSSYGTAVEQSLGLPRLRDENKQLDDAVTATRTERQRIPDGVQTLQRQAQACDAAAANLRSRIPSDAEAPGYANALSAWREQRTRCNALTQQAQRLLAEHRAQQDKELARLTEQREQVRKSLTDANTEHEQTLKRDAPTLNDSATTGFARHAALWSAVDARRIPAWAAYGLMFAVLALDAFSFLIKLVARADAATADRRAEAEAAELFSRLRSTTVAQQRRMVGQAVAAQQSELLDELAATVCSAVGPAVTQELEGRAFDQAAQAVHRAQRRSGKPAPGLVRRLAEMAATAHARRTGRDNGQRGIAAAAA